MRSGNNASRPNGGARGARSSRLAPRSLLPSVGRQQPRRAQDIRAHASARERVAPETSPSVHPRPTCWDRRNQSLKSTAEMAPASRDDQQRVGHARKWHGVMSAHTRTTTALPPPPPTAILSASAASAMG
jgi:hypothetical protein